METNIKLNIHLEISSFQCYHKQFSFNYLCLLAKNSKKNSKKKKKKILGEHNYLRRIDSGPNEWTG